VSLSRADTPSTVRRWLRTLATAALLTVTTLFTSVADAQETPPAGDDTSTDTDAQGEGTRNRVHTASVVVPSGWSWDDVAPVDLGGMPAHIGVTQSPDERIIAYAIVIDPFGVDLEDWGLDDILVPTVLDLMSTAYPRTRNMRPRETDCTMAGEEREGVLVIFPKEGDEKRLVCGLACGVQEPTRWGLVLVLVDSWYERPLLLEQELDQAATFVESFRFEE